MTQPTEHDRASEPQEYESLPRRIKAAQFDPDHKPWPLNVRDNGSWAGATFYVWNELHRSQIEISPGDYVRVDDPNDTYPIDRKKFEETYRLAQHDRPANGDGTSVCWCGKPDCNHCPTCGRVRGGP